MADPNIEFVLSWRFESSSPSVKLAALLLNGINRVTHTDHTISEDQPEYPGGLVHLRTRGESSRMISLDVDGLPRTVSRVLLVATCAGGTFDEVHDLRLTSSPAGGTESFQFDLVGETHTALLVGELYRRLGRWRFRAIDQGYTEGAAAVDREFGSNLMIGLKTASVGASREAQPDQVPPPGPPASGSVEISGRQGTIWIELLGRPPSADLELSAVALDSHDRFIDLTWFMHPDAFSGGMSQVGTGWATSLRIDSRELPLTVERIVCIAASITLTPMADHPPLGLRIGQNDKTLLTTSISAPADGTGAVLCTLTRIRRMWRVELVLRGHRARTVRELAEELGSFLI